MHRSRLFLKVGGSVCTLLFLVWVEAVGSQAHPGRQAYREVGCAGCHGPRAKGGVDGPAIVPVTGTESEFAQIFQEAMPGFEVTGEELSLIYAYLESLTDHSGVAGRSPDAAWERAEARGTDSGESWAPGSAADVRALREVTAQYAAAWDAGDAKTLSELFAEDAERILINGERVMGRAAIEKQFAQSFVNRPASDTATVTPVSIHFLTSAIAVTHGTWSITNDLGRSASGKYMNVSVKRDDRWLVIRSMVMRPFES